MIVPIVFRVKSVIHTTANPRDVPNNTDFWLDSPVKLRKWNSIDDARKIDASKTYLITFPNSIAYPSAWGKVILVKNSANT